jgi:hypothetical protein
MMKSVAWAEVTNRSLKPLNRALHLANQPKFGFRAALRVPRLSRHVSWVYPYLI